MIKLTNNFFIINNYLNLKNNNWVGKIKKKRHQKYVSSLYIVIVINKLFFYFTLNNIFKL